MKIKKEFGKKKKVRFRERSTQMQEDEEKKGLYYLKYSSEQFRDKNRS